MKLTYFYGKEVMGTGVWSLNGGGEIMRNFPLISLQLQNVVLAVQAPLLASES